MASDITSGCEITDMGYAIGQSVYKTIIITTAATADTADYVTLTPTKWGTIRGVIGFEEDTPSQEQPSWVVSTGVITLGGTANNDVVRHFEVIVSK